MGSPTVLDRLRDASDDGPLDRLAALVLDVHLGRPLGDLLPPDFAVRLARRGLEGWLDTETATDGLERLVRALRARLAGDRRPLAAFVPHDLRHAVRELVGRPLSPDKRLVMRVINRGPTRELVRQLLLDTILEFGGQVSAPVAGVASRLGFLARAATETVKSYSGGLGTLVGAMSDEVERQLEKRAVEFVDAALAGVFERIADAVSDPGRATEAAELRLAVFDGVLELTLAQLADELDKADPAGGAEVLRGGLKRWLASAASDAHLAALAAFALGGAAAQPVAESLREAGLLDAATTLGREWLRIRMLDVVRSPAFATWLAGLAAPDA